MKLKKYEKVGRKLREVERGFKNLEEALLPPF